eukprot:1196110-Prorocentrum_minimum.AAC.5
MCAGGHGGAPGRGHDALPERSRRQRHLLSSVKPPRGRYPLHGRPHAAGETPPPPPFIPPRFGCHNYPMWACAMPLKTGTFTENVSTNVRLLRVARGGLFV